MTMGEKQEVRITGQDIASAGDKLREFAKSLPANEQAVIGWLVERAAEGGRSEDVSGFLLRSPGVVYPSGPSPVNPALFAFGAPQLSSVRPGSWAATSVNVSVGVMF